MKSLLSRAFCSLLICVFFSVAYADATRVERPMKIHRLAELGLEIWTESEPAWETRVEAGKNSPLFVAETPALTYPPAGFTWISAQGMTFAEAELREAARGGIYQAARNYGVAAPGAIELTPAIYGDLTGYEANFGANSQGTAIDVKVFFGHLTGKHAVMIHAFTLQGKMTHISEQIRRAWSHTRYLP